MSRCCLYMAKVKGSKIILYRFLEMLEKAGCKFKLNLDRAENRINKSRNSEKNLHKKLTSF